ncbi:MAG: AAA family ATPase [Lewinellaceae bacterium]|nr:AAA family ATPase [Lewinellaceae bacterium]
MDRLKAGATWLRADFHLHTNADKEFKHDKTEKPGVFAKKYVERLEEEGIGVGVVTNHNKLDYEEFKAIQSRGKKEGILLLPGIELSVKDGARGIHCLIAFNDNWFSQGHNYVEGFLNAAFEGIPNRENENTRCKLNMGELLTKLEEYCTQERDSFIVLAHIEDSSGFYKELEGGRVKEFAENPLFRKFVLGMQKVRTRDKIQNLKQWFKEAKCPLPAFVEGSDCKCLEEVGNAHRQNGKDKKTYIKLGAPSFEAVKFALANHEIRVKPDESPEPSHAHLESISFVGGKLDGQTIYFNADLNCLIGTPGAGKSSILETVRYILDLEFGDNAMDTKYKEDVVSNLMGSGGKGIAKITGRKRQRYTIERTLGELPRILNDLGDEVQMAISEGIISGLYFGQKDLSNINDKFNQSFLDKFIGSALKEVQERISKQAEKVSDIIGQIDELHKVEEEAEALRLKEGQLSEKIRLFDKYDIKKKLGRQEGFEADVDHIGMMEEKSEKEFKKFKSAIENFSSSLEKLLDHKSKENKKDFGEAEKLIRQIQSYLEEVEKRTGQMEKEELAGLKRIREELSTRYNDEKEAFAEVRRAVNVDGELKADDYLKYKRELKATEQKLESLDGQLKQKEKLQKQLSKALKRLRALHKEEAEKYTEAIKMINEEGAGVSVQFTAHGDKEEFAQALEWFFQRTNIRKEYFRNIAEAYKDTIAIYEALYDPESSLADILSGGSHLLNFQNRFEERKAELLTYKSPHHFELLYQGRPIQKYSVGERASALILFTLTMGDNDLIVIDQPEDDLNSQSIYQEVVETLLKSKHKTQFIFATHNPNIPVLGDCEQILCCQYFDDKLQFTAGGIDSRDNQQNIIRIMEGGPEAFQKRTEIYAGWRRGE